jgi:uncharacterized SAM-binding protein YcdF (DUF218 family)
VTTSTSPSSTSTAGRRSAELAAAEVLWRYHRLDHEPRITDVAIGLGGHDAGVARCAAGLYRRGLVPLVVFTGETAPTTRDLFPRGEAVHFRELAIAAGVPDHAVLVEPHARNTAENLTLTRELLVGRGIRPAGVTLVSRPYQQRRAYATARRQWPEVDVVCTAEDVDLHGYLDRHGADRVLTMLVGDTRRIELYAARGHAVEQEVPDDVRQACAELIEAGYTGRLPG